MTASELVARDLARGAVAARPGDIWLSNRSWNRPSWTIRQLEEAKARADHLGGAAGAQRGSKPSSR